MTLKIGSGVRLTNPPSNPEQVPNYLVNLVRDLENILNSPVDLTQFGLKGWYDYNDLATQTTPLSVSSGVRTFLPNDGAGSFTNTDFGVPRLADIYNTSTGAFDFSGLEIGDTVGIRLDLEYETIDPNQTVTQRLDLGIGDPNQYFIKWGSENVYKTATTHQFSLYNKIYIGNALTRDNPAKFSVLSDGALNVTVNGYFIDVHGRSVT